MRKSTGKAILLLTALVLIASLPSIHGSEFPRHVDPEETGEDLPDARGLFMIYSRYFGHLSNFEFSKALRTFKLTGRLDMPSDLTVYHDRLRVSSRFLGISLENFRLDLENAGSLILEDEFERAQTELESARFQLSIAKKKVRAVKESSTELSGRMGADLPVEFTENLSRAENLIESYLSYIEDALEEEDLEGFLSDLPTENISELEEIIGGAENISELEEIIGGAENISELEDLLTSIKSDLAVESPVEVYPGKSFEFKGRLTARNRPLENFEIKAFWMGQTRTMKTDENGEFLGSLLVLPGASTGPSTLEVRSLKRGRVKSSSVARSLLVVRLPSSVNVDKPSISFSGGEMTLRGEVSARDRPLEDSRVVLVFAGDSVASVSGEEGKFEVSIGISISTLSGSHDYKIISSPREPWIRVGEERGRVFVLNPFTVSAAPIAVCIVLGIWWMRREVDGTGSLDRIEFADGAGSIGEEREVSGLKGLFLRAVAMVSDFTGMNMDENQTIREYLADVKEGLGRAFDPFRRLSLKFEKYLYSDHRVEEDRSLLDRITEFLRRG